MYVLPLPLLCLHVRSMYVLSCAHRGLRSTPLQLSTLSFETSDVGFPSVCCEYHWLIKKVSWACTGNRGRWGKLNWMLGERRQSQGETM